jgi:hypothetical protein
MATKQITPTPVRIPVELKTWVRARAAENLRSVNAEIIAVLLSARASSSETRTCSEK